MLTKLPQSINTVQEAKNFLTSLALNNESYHPDDNAHEIIWINKPIPTFEECEQLNKLMSDIFTDSILGPIDPETKNYSNLCPYEFLIAFDNNTFDNTNNRYNSEVMEIKSRIQ